MGYCARDGSGDGKAHYFPRVASGPTLPHVADQNARLSLTAEGVVVSGAGSDIANGAFTQRGIANGKAFFVTANQPTIDTVNPNPAGVTGYLWTGSRWVMDGSDGTEYYFSDDDVARPDLVTTWQQVVSHGDPVGQLPLPTVTHQPGQVTGAGYQVIQDDDGLTYTFNGDGADADAGLWVDGVAYSVSGPANGKNYYNVVGVLHSQTLNTVVWDGASWNNLDALGDLTDSTSDDTEFPLQATWPVVSLQRNPIASTANWTP